MRNRSLTRWLENAGFWMNRKRKICIKSTQWHSYVVISRICSCLTFQHKSLKSGANSSSSQKVKHSKASAMFRAGSSSVLYLPPSSHSPAREAQDTHEEGRGKLKRQPNSEEQRRKTLCRDFSPVLAWFLPPPLLILSFMAACSRFF